MLERIIQQMQRKLFFAAAHSIEQKWNTLNLYEKKRVYYNWHSEWPSKELAA